MLLLPMLLLCRNVLCWSAHAASLHACLLASYVFGQCPVPSPASPLAAAALLRWLCGPGVCLYFADIADLADGHLHLHLHARERSRVAKRCVRLTFVAAQRWACKPPWSKPLQRQPTTGQRQPTTGLAEAQARQPLAYQACLYACYAVWSRGGPLVGPCGPKL
jgi:hypothetical protein